jgi:adenylosuccinate lyase
MKQSGRCLQGLQALAVLSRRAREFKTTVMVGRTHGIHAEPTTFGLKLALWYAETQRNIARLQAARERIAVGQISGAVGTFEHLSPAVEEYVCSHLGLAPAPVPGAPSDRHAELACTLASSAAAGKFATETAIFRR